MKPRLKLDRAAHRRLEKLDRKRPDADARIRIRVVLKVAAGRSCNRAAREVGCVPSTAVRTVARYEREGEAGLLDHRTDNGTRKLDDDVVARVRALLTGRPSDHGCERPTWTLEIQRALIARALGVALSLTHVWRLVKRTGAHWGRPRPIVACPWRTRRRQRRIVELRKLAASASDDEVVLYADEVDIHLNPKIGPDWMLPGVQRQVLTPGQNEKRYLAGTSEPRTQRLVYVEDDGKASWLFLNLLCALLEAYEDARTIHVILDNYVIHKSRVTLAWLAEHGRRLDLHAYVTRNHQQKTIGALLGRVHRYLGGRFQVERRLLLAA